MLGFFGGLQSARCRRARVGSEGHLDRGASVDRLRRSALGRPHCGGCAVRACIAPQTVRMPCMRFADRPGCWHHGRMTSRVRCADAARARRSARQEKTACVKHTLVTFMSCLLSLSYFFHRASLPNQVLVGPSRIYQRAKRHPTSHFGGKIAHGNYTTVF